MTVGRCDLLKELPHGFGALPALKSFVLNDCDSFVNLPGDFTELSCLEELHLVSLPSISRIPDGCGKLKKLRLDGCLQLKTLSDDFENMAALEEVSITNCSQLDGAMMEKILKLQNCYTANIKGSTKLVEKWKQMWSQIENPIALFTVDPWQETMWYKFPESLNALSLALLHGKCMELNNHTHQLMERSSLLVGLEEGTTTTVALVMLHFNIQSDEQQTIQRSVEMARERAKTNGSAKLQIVCARKKWKEKPTQTKEEEKAEEEDISRILVLLPKGSCAIPSSESKRVKVLSRYCHYYNVFMGDVVDIEGCKNFENVTPVMIPSIEPKNSKPQPKNSVENFLESIIFGSGRVSGQSMTREFVEALKSNGIHHLIIPNNTSKVMVDDLHGKTIGFIICRYSFLKCVKLEQIYKDLQQKDSNFIAVWIPLKGRADYGYGSYTRFIQCMPWATFSVPPLLNNYLPCFVVVDKYGQIANYNAMPLLLAWGAKSYPFTQHTIPERSSLMESESCVEFLLDGMNIVGRKKMKSKMTFLYAEDPRGWHKMKPKLEQLAQIHGNFEVLYVGKFQGSTSYIEYFKQAYEDAIQYTYWPTLTLSFSDMVMFWHRCLRLASKEAYKLNKESNIMMEALHGLVDQLIQSVALLVLMDNDGTVTCDAHRVVEMICEPSDGISEEKGMVKDELMKSLSRGECSSIVKTFFRDEIHNPLHPQHGLTAYPTLERHVCNVCSKKIVDDGKRTYRCSKCDWDICWSCWTSTTRQR